MNWVVGNAYTPHFGFVRPSAAVQDASMIIPLPRSNYTVEAEVEVPGGGNVMPSIVGRASYAGGQWTHYKAYLNGNSVLGIYKKVGASNNLIASKTMSGISPSSPHELRLELYGPQLRLYLDGKLELSVADNSITAGAPGISTDNSVPHFRRFACYASDAASYNSLWTSFHLEGVTPTTDHAVNVVKVPGRVGGEVQIGPSIRRSYHVTGHFVKGDGDIPSSSSFLRSLSTSGCWAYLRSPLYKVSGVIRKPSGPTYVYKGKDKVAHFSFDIIEAARPRA